MVSSCLLWVLLLGTFGGVHGAPAVFDVQAEEGQGFDPANVHWRSNAEGKQAVWLRNDERLNFTFCLPADDNITVLEIRFSSDGAEKEGAVLIDGTEVSTQFLLKENGGERGRGGRGEKENAFFFLSMACW